MFLVNGFFFHIQSFSMKIFLCKWPDLDVTIIAAKSLEEVFEYLDEYGDPLSCIVKEYKGPMVLDFRGPNFLKPAGQSPFFVEGDKKIFNGHENEPKKQPENFYSKYFNSEIFSDIVLCVDGRKIPSHRIILSQYSLIFTEKVLNCDELEINDVKYENFLIILYFLYKNHLNDFDKKKEHHDIQFWLDCLKFARKLKINRLNDLIQIEIMNAANVKGMDIQNGFGRNINLVEANNILKIVHQCNKEGAVKFVAYALERLAHHYVGDLEQLDGTFVILFQKSWNL
jgi:hypothetical protein